MSENHDFQFYFISKEEDLKSFDIEFEAITKTNPEWVKNEDIKMLDTLFSDENLQKAFEDENDVYLF